MYMRKFTIGEVNIFGRKLHHGKGHQLGKDWYDLKLLGDERVQALTGFYFDYAKFTKGKRLFVYGHGFITAKDINWDTSSIRSLRTARCEPINVNTPPVKDQL
jgi:hypothetical protein